MRGPWGFDFTPLVVARSGAPFNITTGFDSNGDSLFTERPAFATDLTRPSVVQTRLGALDLDPTPEQKIVPRNFGRGPRFFAVNLQVGKTFGFGREPRAGASPASQRRPTNGWRALLLRRRYNLTFAVEVENLFNNVNPGSPIGNLSSTLFGQSNFSAGSYGFGANPGGNRRISFQIYSRF
jgi:hypothetical protein